MKVIKKPNPVNERNKSLLEEMEAEVKRLEEEKAAWDSLASTVYPIPDPPPAQSSSSSLVPSLADIDLSLLDPSQASLLSALQTRIPQPKDTAPPPESTSTETPPKFPSTSKSTFSFTFTTPAALESHLSTLSLSLEPHIDLFADGVHKIEQYRTTADRVADRILGTAALRLEERDSSVKEKTGSEGIGVGDVLRGLAGVLND